MKTKQELKNNSIQEIENKLSALNQRKKIISEDYESKTKEYQKNLEELEEEIETQKLHLEGLTKI